MSCLAHRLQRHVPSRLVLLAALFVVATVAAGAPRDAAAQKPTGEMIDRGHRMLAQIRKDLREIYFDPTFGGVDVDTHFRVADSAIAAAPTNNHIVAAIAQFVSQLDDSHTHFIPPGRVASVDYGYGTTFVGDSCFITSVKAKSDAESKGIKRGDALLKLDAFDMRRADFGTLWYVYNQLSPRTMVRLIVRSPDGAQRTVDVAARVMAGERTIDYDDVETWRKFVDDADTTSRVNHTWVELGDSVVVWRMAQFAYPDKSNIDAIMKQVRKRRSLVLDLRNNGGGAISTLDYMLGHFFNQEVKVGATKQRSGEKLWSVKPHTNEPFMGMLVVLINSNSGSSSEIFARLMQLEGRAILVGDRSAGAVVTSKYYTHPVGGGLMGRSMYYTTQISIADVVMADGQRLEKIGVTPDHLVLPTSADIAARRDPQLAKALSLVGVSVSPEVAGTLFRARQVTGR